MAVDSLPQSVPPPCLLSTRDYLTAMPKNLYRWRVYYSRGMRAQHIGTVEAPDAQTGIEIAIDEYEVSPEKRGWLMAVKVANV